MYDNLPTRVSKQEPMYESDKNYGLISNRRLLNPNGGSTRLPNLNQLMPVAVFGTN